MKKTIYHDAVLNFGKYKLKNVADVLASDPGYFLWLIESGTYNVDEFITAQVETWGVMNKGEAMKVRHSAISAREKRESENARFAAADEGLPAGLHQAGPPPVEGPKSASWGTW